MEKNRNDIINEFVEEFKKYDIEIEIIEDWIHFKKENPIELFKAFNWDKELINEDFPELKFRQMLAKVMIGTANSYDTLKTNLIITMPDNFPSVFNLNLKSWFNKRNNLLFTKLKISENLKNNFPLIKTFRPTFICHSMTTKIKELEELESEEISIPIFNPISEKSRNVLYKINNTIFKFTYLWNENFEKCQLFINDVLEFEDDIPSQELEETKIFIEAFAKKILESFNKDV